ncbi:MAG: hypothetical protein MSH60_03645 [Ruminococcus sp.]|nr:hypothetical protein [Ruminococcus sp.]
MNPTEAAAFCKVSAVTEVNHPKKISGLLCKKETLKCQANMKGCESDRGCGFLQIYGCYRGKSP